MPLDMEQVRANVGAFNMSLAHLAGDFLTHKFFHGNEFQDSGFEAVRVVLVDVLWATQVNREGTLGRPEEAKPLHLLCAHLRDQFAHLRATLEPLGNADLLENNPELVCAHACAALDIIFNAEGINNKPLSFASKFLHWLAPSHCPIIDDRASKATRDLLPELWEPVALQGIEGEGPEIRKYKRWLLFYSSLLGEVDLETRMALVKYDEETQQNTSATLARRNTILRVLDKHFWIHGRRLAEA